MPDVNGGRAMAVTERSEVDHQALRIEPRWVGFVATVSSGLNRLAALAAAFLLVLMTCHILLEIVLRFFSRSTYMADALVGYGVAAITFLALGWALENGSMIRVSVLTQRMPRRLAWCAEMFAVLATGWLMWFLAGYQWRSVSRAFTRGTVSEHYLPIPLWIPESFFLIGLLLILLHLVVRFLRLITVGLTEESKLVL
ncbi:TRAP transporter small permease subunit [Chelativorans sp. AA-79]|uniref:TRAP transporter small permease n=1 Tax=Chelativorans sp. AA-79 TaxID=3028735 RepID=UPI0023F8AFE4|nr:TRAP transporter small permease subunit [Chelativorans sp. AA-79]WEX11044.1 TRAP transporter small permease subunit [Chelativorans sp. AA-79]